MSRPTTPLPRCLAGTLLALAILVSGCAGPLRVDSQVNSFAHWTAGEMASGKPGPGAIPEPPQTYSFDRLPSQTQGPQARDQDLLEQLAAEALTGLGWTAVPDGSRAPWKIQVGARTQRLPHAPWEDPWYGYRSFFQAGIGLGGYHSGVGGVIWVPVLPPPSPPYYLREVSLVIREAASGRVAYETRASHDGRWNSTPELWSAMLRAALQDFPNPPSGPRRVDVEIPSRQRQP